MLCQCVGNLIRRFQQHGIQTIPHRHLVAYVHSRTAASLLHTVDRIMGKGHYIIQVAVLNDDQGSQDLGDAGRIIHCM